MITELKSCGVYVYRHYQIKSFLGKKENLSSFRLNAMVG